MRLRLSPLSVLSWSLVGLFPLLLYHHWEWVVDTRPNGVRLFFDHWDISYFFSSAAWAVGPERLFVDSGADYPLLANLLFGAVRFLSTFVGSFSSPLDAFAWAWMSLSWLAYVAAVRLVRTRLGWTAALMWLAPATLYFALLRYDVYPALACLLALAGLQRERWTRGAAWFAVCIALKGYALLMVPALFTFLMQRVGTRRACELTTLAVGPFVAGNLLVYWLAGASGLLHGYQFHLGRGVAVESTYGAVAFVGGALGLWPDVPGAPVPFGSARLAVILQTLSALVAAAFRPRSFDELVHALLFALLGFVVSAIFWSEQFILWIVAVACFSSRRLVVLFATLMCWATFVEFPVLYDLLAGARNDPPRRVMYRGIWRSTLVLTSALRVAIMGAALPWRNAKRGLRLLRRSSPTR